MIKKKIDVDSLKEDQKEFVNKNKLILKTQQKFKSERRDAFTEEIKKIDLSLMLMKECEQLV